MKAIIVLMDTLRRDFLSCYSSGGAPMGLAAKVKTPNLDRMAAMGTMMLEAYLGSSPCMPARRELWTGRCEFPWRGWGPLEDDDLDVFNLLRSNGIKTAMVSDHYHLLERDAGNYHFGFQEWDMIRGQEHDPYLSDPTIQTPVDHLTSPVYQHHLQNLRGRRRSEEELYSASVFRKAASWLEQNGTRRRRKDHPFCLFVECFDPHEPWDPPIHLVEQFDPDYDGHRPHSPSYGPAARFTDRELRQIRALYAAELTVVDHWFGVLLHKLDELGLWDDTIVIATTDHGFYLGERDLVGKPDRVPLFPEMSRIPFLTYIPGGKAGQQRSELVQLVDVFPTVLDWFGVSLPSQGQVKPHLEQRGQASRCVETPEAKVADLLEMVGSAGKRAWEGIGCHALSLHGHSLLPLLKGVSTVTRGLVCTAKYGDVVRISDGEWTLYLPPLVDLELYWYGVRPPGRLFGGRRGPLNPEDGRYRVSLPNPTESIRLYHTITDPDETENVADEQSDIVEYMKTAFGRWLREIVAPTEVAIRYGVATADE